MRRIRFLAVPAVPDENNCHVRKRAKLEQDDRVELPDR